MPKSKELSPAQKLVGDFAPKLAEITDDVLFGDVWERAELSKRDRSLITVAALIANGNTEQLTGHLNRARDNGLSEIEIAEVIIHLAFYCSCRKLVVSNCLLVLGHRLQLAALFAFLCAEALSTIIHAPATTLDGTTTKHDSDCHQGDHDGYDKKSHQEKRHAGLLLIVSP